MARFDRCVICDYSQEAGSELTQTPPRANGKVRSYGDDLRCDVCAEVIKNAAYDFRTPEEIDEDLIVLEE